MSNPLEPIWNAHRTAAGALKVVRRCATLAGIDSRKPFGHTPFERLAPADVESRLDDAGDQIDAQTVLFLYAAFEAQLRDHLASQADLLKAAGPDADFGSALAAWFAEACGDMRMDDAVDLFLPTIGRTLKDQVATIRMYRHWLAHGRRGPTPASITAQFAFETLSKFLEQCGIG